MGVYLEGLDFQKPIKLLLETRAAGAEALTRWCGGWSVREGLALSFHPVLS